MGLIICLYADDILDGLDGGAAGGKLGWVESVTSREVPLRR